MSESPIAEKKQHCENHQRCMEMIQAVLDGSATPEEMEHFKSSIQDCLPCIEGYQLEKELKNTLANKVERKCCPDKTVSLIKDQIGLALAFVSLLALQYTLFYSIFIR
jgi:hypothetical protein